MAAINAKGLFLGLPPELRNKVYEHLLKRNGREVYYQGWLQIHADGRGWARSTMLPIYPEILRTCRQIHHEARAVLYGENGFLFRGTKEVWASHMCDFSQPREMERFFDIIGFSNAAMIKMLRVDTAWTMVPGRKFRFFFEWGDDAERRVVVRSGTIKDAAWKDAGWKKRWSIECILEVVDGSDSAKSTSRKVEAAMPS